MKSKSLMMLVVLMLISLSGLASSVSAQVRSCSLALHLISVDEDNQIVEIKDARATARRVNSRRYISAILVSGEPEFPRLSAGDYRLTIFSDGFKRTIQDVSFRCVNRNGKGRAVVRLEPGNSTQTVVASKQDIFAGATTVLGTLLPEPSAGPTQPRAALSGGVLNGKAVSLPKPTYPPIARQAHAEGIVTVQVIIDEQGNVISARAVGGHPLLQAVSVEAARNAKFSPTKLAGQPVKVSGLITYNFIAQ